MLYLSIWDSLLHAGLSFCGFHRLPPERSTDPLKSGFALRAIYGHRPGDIHGVTGQWLIVQQGEVEGLWIGRRHHLTYVTR